MDRAGRRVFSWWRIVIPGSLALTFGVGIGMNARCLAKDASATSSRPTTQTSANSSEKHLEEKLDQILDNQDKILKRFDDVMEELRIVKIRATLK